MSCASSASILPRRFGAWRTDSRSVVGEFMRFSAKEATRFILEGGAPSGLETGVLDFGLAETRQPVRLPENLRCYSLRLAGQPIQSLPAGLQVEYRLDLSNCPDLVELPRGLTVSTLLLTNCRALSALPEGLESNFLQLDGCTSLCHWPEDAQVTCGWVRARGCAALERLPQRLGPLASLDLRDCRRITSVPAGVEILSWLDVGNTRITSLPESLCGIALRWRGVPVTPRIAFYPEKISSPDILVERNVELRRVMIE